MIRALAASLALLSASCGGAGSGTLQLRITAAPSLRAVDELDVTISPEAGPAGPVTPYRLPAATAIAATPFALDVQFPVDAMGAFQVSLTALDAGVPVGIGSGAGTFAAGMDNSVEVALSIPGTPGDLATGDDAGEPGVDLAGGDGTVDAAVDLGPAGAPDSFSSVDAADLAAGEGGPSGPDSAAPPDLSGDLTFICPPPEKAIDYEWTNWPMPNPTGAGLPNPAVYDASAVGVVADRVTGLLWQADSALDPASFTWADAKAYCTKLQLDGCGSWRLPTRIELVSLVDFTTTRPSIDHAAFPATPSAGFWSATPLAGYPTLAWNVVFAEGVTSVLGVGAKLRVRCVR